MSPDSQAPAPPAPKARVLVLDDEASIRRILELMLTRLGHPVETAGSGEEAIRRYCAALQAGQPFGAVIIDLNLRDGRGGLQTLREIQAADPAVRAIVSSGSSRDPIVTEHRQHGFCGVLPKPFRVQDVTDALAAALGSA
jgi:DNA-binding NtrC family response regulator